MITEALGTFEVEPVIKAEAVERLNRWIRMGGDSRRYIPHVIQWAKLEQKKRERRHEDPWAHVAKRG